MVENNQSKFALWTVVIVAVLILLLLLTRRRPAKKRKVAIAEDLALEDVMELLRDASEHAQTFVTDQRAKVGEQEREVMERQMQLQKLEEQVLQMKNELRMLDEAPQELKDKIKEINERTAQEIKSRIYRRSYSMLFLGFLLGVIGVVLGSVVSVHKQEVFDWLAKFF